MSRRHWVARMEAIGIIGKMTSRGDQRAVTAIMGTVNDEHGGVRAKSVHVLSLLANVGDMQVVSLLIDRIDDEDPTVRKEVIGGLRIIGRKNDEASVLDICNYMDSPKDEVRTTAIHCLHAVVRPGYRAAIVEVCARLEAPSHSVKMNALAALPLVANKGDHVAIVEVANRINHPIPAIRSVALQGLNCVANKGDRFALAAVGNLMEHPDYEVRRAAAQGVQLLCYPGDLAAIQVVVMRLKIDTDAECVREGAKYVAAPTTGNPPGWRDPALPQFGPTKLRGDPVVFDRILTPRLPYLMPIGRDATVAYHTPVLPAEKGVRTIAQMWWRDKYQGDMIRHRYEWMGPETAGALGSSSRPGTSIMSRPGTSSLRHRSAGAKGKSPVLTISDGAATQMEIIGGEDDGNENGKEGSSGANLRLPSRGILGRSGTRDGRPRTVIVDERVQTAVSGRSAASYGSSRSGVGVKSREQRKNEKMQEQSKVVLDVLEKGLITDALIEAGDLGHDQGVSPFGYKFPTYSVFYEALSWTLKENEEEYKWWNHRLIFPAPDDKSASDEDRNLPRIRTLLEFNAGHTKDLRLAWQKTRHIWRKYATVSSGKDPIPEILAKKEGTLHITIQRARNLPRFDRFGGCDCYVDLTMPGRGVKKTKVVNKQLDPEWVATFSFDVTDLDFKDPTKVLEQGRSMEECATKIEGIEDDDAFEPPEGLVGLYYDQKLTMPVTRTELQGPDEDRFKEIIAHLAEKDSSHVELLKSEQTEPRARDIFFRVHTSDMLETISMAGRLSEANLQQGFLESELLDVLRLEDVSSQHLTTAETLSKVSAPVQVRR